MDARVLGREVAAPRQDFPYEPAPVRKDRSHPRAGRQPAELHLEPVPCAAGVVQEHESAADRVDGDVDAPVVVVVRGRDAPSVHERDPVEPQVLEPTPVVAEHLHRSGVLRQVRHGDGAVGEHEVELAVVPEVDP